MRSPVRLRRRRRRRAAAAAAHRHPGDPRLRRLPGQRQVPAHPLPGAGQPAPGQGLRPGRGRRAAHVGAAPGPAADRRRRTRCCSAPTPASRPKFLKAGSTCGTCRARCGGNNLGSMLGVATDQHAADQVPGHRGAAVRRRPARRPCRSSCPPPSEHDWEMITAGQRVQVIKRDPATGRGVLQFGTELVVGGDGSIAGLLGASPGASTAVVGDADLLERCFPRADRRLAAAAAGGHPLLRPHAVRGPGAARRRSAPTRCRPWSSTASTAGWRRERAVRGTARRTAGGPPPPAQREVAHLPAGRAAAAGRRDGLRARPAVQDALREAVERSDTGYAMAGTRARRGAGRVRRPPVGLASSTRPPSRRWPTSASASSSCCGRSPGPATGW